MPITVHHYNQLTSDTICDQLTRLYDTSPEFGDGQDAIEQLEAALQKDSLVYTAEFNEKIIAAVWCSGVDNTRLIHYVVVHPSNRGRGVAERLIAEVCEQEEAKGATTFKPGCGAIHRCLAHLGKI